MEQRPRRAILTLILLVYGCSPSPATPALAPPLAAGTYMLSIMAPDGVFVNGQLVSACPDAAAASAVIAVATVSADRDVSRVRPVSAAEGTFEMELVRDTGSAASNTAVSGTVRGMAINTRYAATSDGHPADARALSMATAPLRKGRSPVMSSWATPTDRRSAAHPGQYSGR